MNRTVKFTGLLSLIIAGASLTAQPVVNGNYLAIYRSPWHMVKDLFITQPSNESKKYHTTLRGSIKSALYGIGTTAGLFALDKFILAPLFGQPDAQENELEMRDMTAGDHDEETSTVERSLNSLPVQLVPKRPSLLERFARIPLKKRIIIYLATGTIIAYGGTGYKIAERFWKGPKFYRAEQLKMMETILDRWTEVRSYFPESIQPMFDTLCELRKTSSPEYQVNVESALEVIKTEVAIHAR